MIATVIREPTDVTLEVFDVAGRRVLTSQHAGLSSGSHTLPLSSRDSEGHELPSGVYLYRLTAARESVTRKLVICR